MAGVLLAREISELCLGKPPLRSLSVVSATVGDALAALNSGQDDTTTFISVWSCDHSKGGGDGDCICIGKICTVDIISYLISKQNNNTENAPCLPLQAPLSVLLSQICGSIRHVEPSSSVLVAMDLMIQGVANVVVPIERTKSRRKLLHKSKSSPMITTNHNGQEFCCLTQEDVIRYLLGSIGLFSPLPMLSINALGIITAEFLTIRYHSPATSAVEAIQRSLADQTAVAAVDDEGIFLREISASTLACCDETLPAVIGALSTGDLVAYVDGDYRRVEPSFCHPGSSLVAVMIQAIAHRINCVWVIEDDWSVVGIVTFSSMLQVFRQY